MTTTIYQLNKRQCEREAAYLAALALIDRIDDNLTRGIRHYRTCDGRLLKTLDEFVRAAIEGELMTCPPRVEWLGEM